MQWQHHATEAAADIIQTCYYITFFHQHVNTLDGPGASCVPASAVCAETGTGECRRNVKRGSKAKKIGSFTRQGHFLCFPEYKTKYPCSTDIIVIRNYSLCSCLAWYSLNHLLHFMHVHGHVKLLWIFLLRSHQLKSVTCCWAQLRFLCTWEWFVEIILQNLYFPRKTENCIELVFRELIPCKKFAGGVGWQCLYRRWS